MSRAAVDGVMTDAIKIGFRPGR